jgi:hypothetical protein
LTTDFLDRLDLSPEAVQAFEGKRRELLAELTGFHSDFRRQLDLERDLPLEMTRKLEEFRIFQEVFVQIMLEKGEEIISRATVLKERLRSEMAVIASGKAALHGYDGKRGVLPHSLNKAA